MKKSSAIQHFGGVTKLSGLLGISRQAIYMWPDEVPDLYQYKLHYLSEQRLPLGRAARGAIRQALTRQAAR